MAQNPGSGLPPPSSSGSPPLPLRAPGTVTCSPSDFVQIVKKRLNICFHFLVHVSIVHTSGGLVKYRHVYHTAHTEWLRTFL